MKASPNLFEAVAELVAKGLSPSRAAKVLKIAPSTISDWRADYPEFSAMLDQAESAFVGRMIACVAAAAPKDWRAAVELLARRFPSEFSANSTTDRGQPEYFVDREAELVTLASTPTGRTMLLKLGLITPAWIAERFPAETPLLLDAPRPEAAGKQSTESPAPRARL